VPLQTHWTFPVARRLSAYSANQGQLLLTMNYCAAASAMKSLMLKLL